MIYRNKITGAEIITTSEIVSPNFERIDVVIAPKEAPMEPPKQEPKVEPEEEPAKEPVKKEKKAPPKKRGTKK